MGNLDDTIAALAKQYGPGSAFRFTDIPETDVTGWTSTGVKPIDEIIGRPGIPDGRVTTIIGPPSASKTTLAKHIIVSHQKRSPDTQQFYINSEEAWIDEDRDKRIGVDLSRLVLLDVGTSEDVFEMIAAVCQASDPTIPKLMIWDTFSASPLRSEVYGTGQAAKTRIENDILDPTAGIGGHALGEHARLVSQQMRKLQGVMANRNLTLVTILQSKEKIGLTFGSGVSYLAERPWYFYSNVQLECKRVATINKGSTNPEAVGIEIEVSCRKNKLAAPFKKCKVHCLFEHGIDLSKIQLEQAVKANKVLQKGAGWFETTIDGKVIKFTADIQGNSKMDWRTLLKENPTFLEGVPQTPSEQTIEAPPMLPE